MQNRSIVLLQTEARAIVSRRALDEISGLESVEQLDFLVAEADKKVCEFFGACENADASTIMKSETWDLCLNAAYTTAKNTGSLPCPTRNERRRAREQKRRQ